MFSFLFIYLFTLACFTELNAPTSKDTSIPYAQIYSTNPWCSSGAEFIWFDFGKSVTLTGLMMQGGGRVGLKTLSDFRVKYGMLLKNLTFLEVKGTHKVSDISF